MKKDMFIDFIEEHVGQYLEEKHPEAALHIRQIEKTSGSYLGLCIESDEVPVAPTINLDDLYERKEEPLEAVNFVVNTYEKTVSDYEEGKMSEITGAMEFFSDYEQARKHFVVAPICAERAVALADVPQTEMDGIHFCVKMIVSRQEDATATATVHNSHLTVWGIDKDKLFEDAWESMKELRPGRLRSMVDVLKGFADDMPELLELPEDEMLYVYTSDDQLDGGSTIFIEGAKEAIADRLQDSYFVLFSSIHESLIVPEHKFGSGSAELHQLQDMLDSGNASLVEPEEIMATSPFHFDRVSGVFEPISSYAARTRGLRVAIA